MKRYWIFGFVLVLLAAGKFGYDYFYFDAKERDRLVREITKPSAPIVALAQTLELPRPLPAAPTGQEIQQALADLGIPIGEVDGKWGARTRQALCIWRELTGRQINRNLPIELEQYAIVEFARNWQGTKVNQGFKLPNSFVVGLNINRTCQSAIWVKDKASKEIRTMIASTGMPGFETDVGNFKVGWKVNRWYLSIIYPDGWMYRPLFFNGGQAVHGSQYDSYVHWFPASHGCVRMLGKDIDALWAGGFGNGSAVRVYGDWNPYTQDPAN